MFCSCFSTRRFTSSPIKSSHVEEDDDTATNIEPPTIHIVYTPSSSPCLTRPRCPLVSPAVVTLCAVNPYVLESVILSRYVIRDCPTCTNFFSPLPNTTIFQRLLTVLEHASRDPDILPSFIENLIITAIEYMDRIVFPNNEFSEDDLSVMFCFAILAASKYLDDYHMKTNDLALLLKLNLYETIKLEFEFMDYLDWDLSVCLQE